MKIELDYVKVGDYYLPDLTIEPPPDRSLGKYGLLWLRYLKEHRPVVWAELVMEGKLYAHLLETEDAANDLLECMMPGMAKEAGATEDLKARDPMRWVDNMESIDDLENARPTGQLFLAKCVRKAELSIRPVQPIAAAMSKAA